jgi:hypothetical protein
MIYNIKKMEKNINEDFLKHQQLLMSYNTKKTLSENVNSSMLIEGVADDILGLTAREIRAELQPVFNELKTTDSFRNVSNIDDIADLLTDALKDINVSRNAKVIEDFKNTLKQSSNLSPRLLSSVSKSLYESENFLKKYGEYIINGDMTALKTEMRNSGKYSDEVINKLASDVHSNSQVIRDARRVKNNVTPRKKTYKERLINIYNAGKGKITKERIKKMVKAGFLKVGKDGRLRISKGKVLFWAAAVGITYWKLSSWLGDNNIVVEDDNKTNTDNTNNTNNTNVVKFNDCSSFPYKLGCINPIIGEVQKCLGLTVDNKFGKGTEDKLVSNGYGKEISQDVYNKIIEKCKPEKPTPTPTPLTNDQLYGIEPNPNQKEKGTGYNTISMDDFK